MNKKYDILTSLDVCVDLIISGDTRPEFGQKEKLVDDYFIEMGGSNCIFACQAAKLGMSVAGVGVAGDDIFGELVKSSLHEAGVDISHVRTEPSYKTAIGVALCEDKDRAILTYLGTIGATGLEYAVEGLLPQTRHLHIGSYYLMDGIRPYWFDIAKRAKKMGLSLSLDTNWDPEETWQRGLCELLPYVDILFPNENEAMHMTGRKNDENAAQALLEHVQIVALKKGENGAKIFKRGGEAFFLPCRRAEYVDSIGAGDSFAAGFLFGFLRNEPLEMCLEGAILCGSMSTRGRGGIAKQLTLGEMRSLVCDTILDSKLRGVI